MMMFLLILFSEQVCEESFIIRAATLTKAHEEATPAETDSRRGAVRLMSQDSRQSDAHTQNAGRGPSTEPHTRAPQHIPSLDETAKPVDFHGRPKSHPLQVASDQVSDRIPTRPRKG